MPLLGKGGDIVLLEDSTLRGTCTFKGCPPFGVHCTLGRCHSWGYMYSYRMPPFRVHYTLGGCHSLGHCILGGRCICRCIVLLENATLADTLCFWRMLLLMVFGEATFGDALEIQLRCLIKTMNLLRICLSSGE
ncbi:hypothetical protein CDAR_542891 [Caerostris darwini]|uniref:Uncharacterized protein n=1 Tax=Caerostris darwini TaxID=1538125 RepID=A0AAV4QJA6_9ARAC|nr:hypothetical protein CDAR_542891 [Caerostris darwini]